MWVHFSPEPDPAVPFQFDADVHVASNGHLSGFDPSLVDGCGSCDSGGRGAKSVSRLSESFHSTVNAH